MPRCLISTARCKTALLTLAGLMLALTGCSPGSQPRLQTLQLVYVPIDELQWIASNTIVENTIAPLIETFETIHPEVDVNVSIVPEAKLVRYLELAKSRGLGPDVLIVRAPIASDLLNKQLVSAIPLHAPIRKSLDLLTDADLKKVSTSHGIAGIPIFRATALACYDRSKLKQAPTTLDQLLTTAASGHPTGLSLDPIGLGWTIGALGAQRAIGAIVYGDGQPNKATHQREEQELITWLSWLRQSVLLSRMDLANGLEDLTNSLVSGRLAWIPCFSLSLSQLEQKMGERLGVAPLPSGPGGAASPYTSLRVIALGVDSSAHQSDLALDLMALSLEPRVQRQLTLNSLMFLPMNKYVPIPVSSSQWLAVQAESFEQSSARDIYYRPIEASQEQRIFAEVAATASNVMLGLSSPEQGAQAILKLHKPPLAGTP